MKSCVLVVPIEQITAGAAAPDPVLVCCLHDIMPSLCMPACTTPGLHTSHTDHMQKHLLHPSVEQLPVLLLQRLLWMTQ
jgi:hypothetical protein